MQTQSAKSRIATSYARPHFSPRHLFLPGVYRYLYIRINSMLLQLQYNQASLPNLPTEKAAGATRKILPQVPSLPRNSILERASFLNQTPQPSKMLPISWLAARQWILFHPNKKSALWDNASELKCLLGRVCFLQNVIWSQSKNIYVLKIRKKIKICMHSQLPKEKPTHSIVLL